MYLSKNHKVLNALPPLTQFQLDIINGCLLGDGHCSKIYGNTNSRFKNDQAIYRLEYVKWLYEALLPYSISVDIVPRIDERFKNKNYEICLIRTHNHPIFTNIRKKWYIDCD